MKDLLTDQLFSELSAAISAEISSTSDSSIVKVILSAAKSVLTILCCFFHKAVRTALKNINSLISANSVFQAVRIVTSAISSDSQAVRVISSAHKSHD